MNYLKMLRSYPRFLSYAVTHSFFAGIGQSIVIAFFIPHFREEFNLQNVEFGYFYAGATLLASCMLPFVGKLIDHVNLRAYSLGVGLTLVSSCLILGLSPNLWILFIGMMFLRLSGQSLMGHIASTTMARYFSQLRGKALGIAGQGHPLGEGFFPILLTQLLIFFGWRTSYGLVAAFCLITFFPMTLSLIKKGDPFLVPPAKSKDSKDSDIKHYNRMEVLKTPFFYCVIPMAVATPFLATGFFLNHANVAAAKGWTMEWMATSILGFSFFRIVGSLWGGSLIDRYQAKKLYAFHLIPMAIGLTVLALSSHLLIAFVYFSLMGLSIGFEVNVKSALWAEVYGTKHLGAIRSLVLTIMIFSTAVASVLFGWYFDKGFEFNGLLMGSLVFVVGSSLLAYVAPSPHLSKSH